jgi:hypothetical protein
MKLMHRSQVSVFLKAFAVFALGSIGTFAQAHDASISALKAGMEGAYVLESWQRKGEILRPPAVDARAVLLNGHILFIAYDRASGANRTTIAGYGTYTFEPGKYSYGYERYSVVTQTPEGTLISDTLPWDGMRTFSASVKNDELRLQAIDGPQEMRITRDRLSYTDGEQTRVYRRQTK